MTRLSRLLDASVAVHEAYNYDPPAEVIEPLNEAIRVANAEQMYARAVG